VSGFDTAVHELQFEPQTPFVSVVVERSSFLDVVSSPAPPAGSVPVVIVSGIEARFVNQPLPAYEIACPVGAAVSETSVNVEAVDWPAPSYAVTDGVPPVVTPEPHEYVVEYEFVVSSPPPVMPPIEAKFTFVMPVADDVVASTVNEPVFVAAEL
jgi:hypothetical protein